MQRERSVDDPILAAAACAEARFVPREYEPNYAYPLLILLHPRGSDEERAIVSVPALSSRNYIGLSLRGPEELKRRGRTIGFGWGPEFADPDRPRHLESEFAGALNPAERVRRFVFDGVRDSIDRIEDSLTASVREIRRSLNVHTERVFLVGRGEGAAAAYRLAFSHPERYAGVVAINGWIPAGFAPLVRFDACRSLRVFIAHGDWNVRPGVNRVLRDARILHSAGLDTTFRSYPAGGRVTPKMRTDINEWLIGQCVKA